MTDLELLQDMFEETREDIARWRAEDKPNSAAIVAARRQMLDLREQIRALEEAERPQFSETDYPQIAERIKLLLRHPEIRALVDA